MRVKEVKHAGENYNVYYDSYTAEDKEGNKTEYKNVYAITGPDGQGVKRSNEKYNIVKDKI